MSQLQYAGRGFLAWAFRSRFTRGCEKFVERIGVNEPLACELEALERPFSEELGQVDPTQPCALCGLWGGDVFTVWINLLIRLAMLIIQIVAGA